MIAFRTDSSFEIGTGHVTRCLALAERLRLLGLKSHFFCRDLAGNVSSQIQKLGFDLTLLPENGDDQSAILSLQPQWLVVDHYQLDEAWEKYFDRKIPIFVIDDLMNRHHRCQILLDQNFHENAQARYQKLTSDQTRMLLGPHFALFKVPDPIPPRKNYVTGPKHVVVFFGGSDHSGETFKFLNALQSHPTSHFFHIVITTANPKVDQFKALANGANFEILISPAHWPDLLKTSDFYLGSGGTVTWERMAVGLPGAVISVADNQTEIAQDLGRAGYQTFLGLHTQVHYGQILSKLEEQLKDLDQMQKMSDAGRDLVRPFPQVLIQEIFEPIGHQPLQLKVATQQESRFLFDLRNDPHTRAMSRSTDPVLWETHMNWLEKKLQQPRTRLYVAFVQGKPCAQFRVEASGETSIAIAEAFRGQGLSSKIIQQGCALYAAEFQLEQPFTAQIKPENQASVRSFEKAGFRNFNDSKANESDYITLTFDPK